MEPGEAVGKPRSKKMSVTADYQLLKLTNQLAFQDLKKGTNRKYISLVDGLQIKKEVRIGPVGPLISQERVMPSGPSKLQEN